MLALERQFGTVHYGDVKWYALYIRHQHEKVVAQALSNKGFDVFLPLYAVVHQWKDRRKHLTLPLFPCYVFLRGGHERRLDILTTPGIVRFVGWGGKPVPIPCDEMEAMHKMVDHRERVEPHPYLRCGDRVRVKAGPLEGLEGILVRKKNLVRLVLSIELLERSIAVEIDAWEVERIRQQETCAGYYPSSLCSAAQLRRSQGDHLDVFHRA
jgi:transcription antitermination factor NusG